MESTQNSPNLPICLRWNSSVTSQLSALRSAEEFVDVTLACDGRQLRAHKLVLSAYSPYFMHLFKSTPCSHPVIFLRNVEFSHLSALIEFMYDGEVKVSQLELPHLIRIAEELQIQGLNTNYTTNIDPASKITISQNYAPVPSVPSDQLDQNLDQLNSSEIIQQQQQNVIAIQTVSVPSENIQNIEQLQQQNLILNQPDLPSTSSYVKNNLENQIIVFGQDNNFSTENNTMPIFYEKIIAPNLDVMAAKIVNNLNQNPLGPSVDKETLEATYNDIDNYLMTFFNESDGIHFPTENNDTNMMNVLQEAQNVILETPIQGTSNGVENPPESNMIEMLQTPIKEPLKLDVENDQNSNNKDKGRMKKKDRANHKPLSAWEMLGRRNPLPKNSKKKSNEQQQQQPPLPPPLPPPPPPPPPPPTIKQPTPLKRRAKATPLKFNPDSTTDLIYLYLKESPRKTDSCKKKLIEPDHQILNLNSTEFTLPNNQNKDPSEIINIIDPEEEIGKSPKLCLVVPSPVKPKVLPTNSIQIPNSSSKIVKLQLDENKKEDDDKILKKENEKPLISESGGGGGGGGNIIDFLLTLDSNKVNSNLKSLVNIAQKKKHFREIFLEKKSFSTPRKKKHVRSLFTTPPPARNSPDNSPDKSQAMRPIFRSKRLQESFNAKLAAVDAIPVSKVPPFKSHHPALPQPHPPPPPALLKPLPETAETISQTQKIPANPVVVIKEDTIKNNLSKIKSPKKTAKKPSPLLQQPVSRKISTPKKSNSERQSISKTSTSTSSNKSSQPHNNSRNMSPPKRPSNSSKDKDTTRKRPLNTQIEPTPSFSTATAPSSKIPKIELQFSQVEYNMNLNLNLGINTNNPQSQNIANNDPLETPVKNDSSLDSLSNISIPTTPRYQPFQDSDTSNSTNFAQMLMTRQGSDSNLDNYLGNPLKGNGLPKTPGRSYSNSNSNL